MGYICRKDDVGGTTPDSGTTPAPDAGPAPGPDTQAPQVTITAPSPNTEVPASTTVVVQATDDQGVASVELLVDAVLVASKNVAPYEFSIALQPGTHDLTAVAHDKANNKGQASVTVTVKGSTPSTPSPPDSGQSPDPNAPSGTFGAGCQTAVDCQSQLCIYDPALSANYCSQHCGPEGGCPTNADCLQGSDGSFLCGLKAQQGPTIPQDVTAGCSLGAGPFAPSALLALALLALLALARRR